MSCLISSRASGGKGELKNPARQLYLEAARAALRIRKKWDLGDSPCCPYDLAERMGIDARFSNEIGGLEGLYLCGSPPVILVSAERPAGRQAYTCAHEIGHHAFGDGDTVDEVVGASSTRDFNPKEFRADSFAGHLLMPRSGLEKTLEVRGLANAVLSPVQAYGVASWFGVGYETAVVQLQSFELISAPNAAQLRKVKPQALRTRLLGVEFHGELVLLDQHWRGRPIDVAVEDAVFSLFPLNFEGPHRLIMAGLDGAQAISPTEPGLFRLSSSDSEWSGFARVRPRKFNGRAIYRHLPSENDDE